MRPYMRMTANGISNIRVISMTLVSGVRFARATQRPTAALRKASVPSPASWATKPRDVSPE
jgi:hypothetical protein